ncbi:SGNH/GDSL hydrolase family protein [Tropicimonas sp. TH_r6]|uniref:SGNH/GDSL hydrolase family protein n=1 Tax=Tropicimonas sp. TH_r6 TaxID=3082085 RepID=UPI002953D9FC|nr:SGNH/GDSL hydrolase family protein [Tropicimonas sp. TH_r6]MDV7141395.1 SGNH/GDSL hydrolase family protein [Tropicimonas sp. TH_r6]
MPEPDGPRHGVTGDGAAMRLLVLGDSSAAGVGVAHQRDALTGQLVARLSERSRVNWQLVAVSGATTGWALKRLRAADLGQFDLSVISLGVNDVKNGVPQAIWARNTREILRTLVERHGLRRIYHSAFPPVGRFPLLPEPLRRILGQRTERFDAALREIVQGQPEARFLSLEMDHLDERHMAEDGFHPGAAIYESWAERVERALASEPLGEIETPRAAS